MALFRVLEQPLGLINGYPWPEVGGTIELPDAAGDAMPGLARADVPKVETRPADDAAVETR